MTSIFGYEENSHHMMFVTTRITDGIAPANASGSTDVGSYVHGGQEPAYSMMHIQYSKSHVCTYVHCLQVHMILIYNTGFHQRASMHSAPISLELRLIYGTSY